MRHNDGWTSLPIRPVWRCVSHSSFSESMRHLKMRTKSFSWRRMRKASHEAFNKVLVKRFHTTQTTEAVLLASGLLDEPAEWDKHCCRAAASMILSAVYNYPTIVSERDHTVEAINDCAERLTRAAYPGAYLVEFFTWMRYIPSR